MAKISKKAPKLKKPPSEKEPDKIKRTKVRVIGIGGGAGNIVSEIASRMKKASFVAANTDVQALRTLRRTVLRFQFGGSLTHGLGTGMNAELAREAAMNEKEKIKNLFKDQDFCILIGSLGGGVGSGAGPIFAKLAKASGGITLGVFTLPFKFEGEKKQQLAKDALQKLRPYLNAIAILPNDKIFQIIDKSTPLREALSAINKNLAEGLEGLIETIFLPGLINIDFADLKTILQGQGRFAYFNRVEVQGANRAVEAIKKALNCPLYPYTIRGAKRVLFNITGEKELSLSDVSQVSKTIFELVNPEAKIIFGVSQDKKYKDKIKVALLATGCGVKALLEKTEDLQKTGRRQKKKAGKKVVIKTKKRRTKRRKKSKPKAKPKSKPKAKAKPKKVRIKIRVKKKEPVIAEEPEQIPEEIVPVQSVAFFEGGTKARKNAVQLKKESEEAEKEFLEKERTWELPAFLRKGQNK